MLIDAQELPQMAFCGPEYDKSLFNYIENCGLRTHKPSGGFWASPILDSGITEWEQWCKEEHYTHRGRRYSDETRQAVTPNKSARIFMISADADEEFLGQEYNWDWTEMANDYDAIYVDFSGVGVMHRGSWDLPSIVFFNTDSFTVN